jgi:hypothetical protein
MKKAAWLGLAMVWALGAQAEEVFPREGWAEAPNPLASERAEKGGMLVAYMGPYPKSFNYYLDQNTMSAELFGQFFETLMTQHPLTLEMEPLLAARCVLGDDLKDVHVHDESAGAVERWAAGHGGRCALDVRGGDGSEALDGSAQDPAGAF